MFSTETFLRIWGRGSGGTVGADCMSRKKRKENKTPIIGKKKRKEKERYWDQTLCFFAWHRVK